MPHTSGALELPAPAPEAGESLGDPAIDVLADYFSAVLTAWLDTAWTAVAPGEPVVRTVYKHDPEEIDFRESDLPLLCLWREGDTAPKQLADGYQEMETTLHVLWVPPPAPQGKNARRHAFLSAYSKAIALAIEHERDPAYVHDDDAGDVSATCWGSDVFRKGSIDWWRLQRVTRVPVDIPIDGQRVFRYPAYLATILLGETTDTDPAAFGTVPTSLHTSITTGGEGNRLETGAFRVPLSFSNEFSSEFY
jgi:hypothetical protein